MVEERFLVTRERGKLFFVYIGPKGPCSTNFSELSRHIIVPDRPLC